MKLRWFMSAAAIVLMLGLSACGGSPEPMETPEPMEPGTGMDQPGDGTGEAPEMTPPPLPEPGEMPEGQGDAPAPQGQGNAPAPQDPGAPEVEIQPAQPEEGSNN